MCLCRIHPAAPLWHSELSGGVGQVWECLYLAVVSEETSTQSGKEGQLMCQAMIICSPYLIHSCSSKGNCTLQTTSCSRFRMLSATSPQALEVMQVLFFLVIV